MGKVFGSLLDSQIENDSKCNDNSCTEFIIKYSDTTILHSVYYQHLSHLIQICTHVTINNISHCKIVFKSNTNQINQLYVLTHLLFNERIVYTPNNDAHIIMDYENNLLRFGVEKVDYTIIERNGISYYSHQRYDTEYLQLLRTDPSSLFSFEFGMILQQTCAQVLRKYDINISTSIIAKKLPFWYRMMHEIVNTVVDTFKKEQREKMMPDIFKLRPDSGKLCKDVKGVINSYINCCNFTKLHESINDNNVMILLNYTNSNECQGAIHVNDICTLLRNEPIKLLAMYTRALEMDGWSKDDIHTLYKCIAKPNNTVDLQKLRNKYDTVHPYCPKARLCDHWLKDRCRFGKTCDYAHGLKELRVIWKYIVKAVKYALSVDFLCEYKPQDWAPKNETKDQNILNDYEEKITNIGEYKTEFVLKVSKKCKGILWDELAMAFPQINWTAILYIIFTEYLGYPYRSTPDQYYFKGKRPIISGKEIARIDNKGKVLGVCENSYVRLTNKKYTKNCGGDGIWRFWKYVILPPAIFMQPLIDGMPMTETQFVNALNNSIDIIDSNSNHLHNETPNQLCIPNVCTQNVPTDSVPTYAAVVQNGLIPNVSPNVPIPNVSIPNVRIQPTSSPTPMADVMDYYLGNKPYSSDENNKDTYNINDNEYDKEFLKRESYSVKYNNDNDNNNLKRKKKKKASKNRNNGRYVRSMKSCYGCYDWRYKD